MYFKNCSVIKSILLIEILIFINFFSYFKFFFLNLVLVIEFKKFEIYFKICNEFKFKKVNFDINKIPIISIISPVFNREKYIIRFIKSIQAQNFHNIEIIFVDDNSFDNSVKTIEIFKKEDKRIKLIKNRINKGTLICRNLGVLFSKGKYLIIPDPDDIISKNILNICYNYAEKYKFEIIRFNVYAGNGKLVYGKLYKDLEKKPIYQPKLALYLCYGKDELQRIDGIIYNKFIKREAFIRALNILSSFYLNMHMIFQEDVILTFSLYITARSFFYLKSIGYYYITNAKSITNNLLNELKIKSFLIQLKFIFEYYKNTKYERDIVNLILNIFRLNIKFNINKFYTFKNDLSIYYDILNIYLNCIYITNENKKILKRFKEIIGKKIKT